MILDPPLPRPNGAKPDWTGKTSRRARTPAAEKAPKTAALIVAAGRGLRAGGDVPKQYQLLDGVAVLERAIRALREASGVSHAIVVIHRDDTARYAAIAASIAADSPDFLLAPAFGGATRQASVRAGLEALKGTAPDIVLIHDAARPFVSPALIGRAIDAALKHGAAVPGVAVTDTIRRLGPDNASGETVAREALRAIQTPQAFSFASICEAHARAAANGLDNFTDDGGVAEWAGLDVHVFEGEARNLKLSLPSDLGRGVRNVDPILEIRSGLGYDVHAFGEGAFVMLGGVKIAHDRGVIAHSDGDVLLHALTDAVLGALGDGDLGTHFPPSDERWRDAASSIFLAAAVARVSRRGGRILHLDATVVCEAPRLGPYRDAIRARIAEIACIGIGRVSIKATTSEQLGFTGRREGIAAQAIATIELPPDDSDGDA
ncbi:2-C-methyl-D-erythritol 2,4-cyclodiphosphate synthase [Rhizobiales bacterium GAS191]|nr:2-C-methyl-D-erythritol 2,4-cyclodiphosphate synthase [Rhizobiales bacterium GAS188]SED15923.1 2-C-methyl-D-erythritol 2,4-cyclodiphosphate synthase [Rhizobiales bacterium GAS191]